MPRLKPILFILLAIFLVWVFWYLLYSTFTFLEVYVLSTSIENRLVRPMLVSGVWQLKPLDQAAANSFSNASIPRIIHQAFQSEMVYSNYLPLIASCMNLNPGWTYYLWRDSDAEALIANKYPQFLPRYKNYQDNLERADSIRYIVLHHFGGIYLDMDVECRQPFFPALSRLPAFVDQERPEQSNIQWSMSMCAMNSVMGSVPGHPFFAFMIDAMLMIKHIGNAFDSTGPRLLTLKYAEYSTRQNVPPVAIMDPRVFSPLMDPDKNWRARCQQYMRNIGCMKLAEQNWRMDITDEGTLAIHRFLHLGYNFKVASRRKPVSLTGAFPGRVNFFSLGNASHRT